MCVAGKGTLNPKPFTLITETLMQPLSGLSGWLLPLPARVFFLGGGCCGVSVCTAWLASATGLRAALAMCAWPSQV